MTRAFRSIALVALPLPALGCAGGWRNGVPPQWAGDDVAASAPATASSAASAGAGSAVTADGVTFRYKGEGNTVNVAGEFNSWSTSADALTKGSDGTWTIQKKLSPGRYAYKFVVDGSNWKEDPAAKETVDDGFGGKNAIMVVAGGASGSGGASPAAAAVLPVTGVAKAPQFGTNGVTFTYAGPGSAVALCGSFNDWAITTDPMKQQSDGTWAITKKLAPGTYTYKFLIDGKTWKTDAANKATQEDDFGGQNSVLIVK